MTGAATAAAVLARIGRQRDLTQVMSEHGKSITVRVTSRDNSVAVEVDGVGAMTGLWLGDSAYRGGTEALATLITETAHAAATVALERQRQLIREYLERLTALRQQ